MKTFIIAFILAAIFIQLFLIFAYNRPHIEINVTRGEEYDTYRIYLNYIKYTTYFIDDCECSEKEPRNIKLFTFKRRHK